MDKQSRREAIAAYKERKVRQGVYVVRCAASGEAWLGLSRNLDAQWNSISMGLRHGSYRNKALQAAWAAHGADAVALEVIEVVDTEDLSPYMREGRLKERLAHWLAETPGARPILA